MSPNISKIDLVQNLRRLLIDKAIDRRTFVSKLGKIGISMTVASSIDNSLGATSPSNEPTVEIEKVPKGKING